MRSNKGIRGVWWLVQPVRNTRSKELLKLPTLYNHSLKE